MRSSVLAAGPVLAILASAAIANAQDATPQGHWEGSITGPEINLKISVGLAQRSQESWVGEISIPAQGLRDFALSSIEVDGGRVAFSMQGIPGSPQFRGKLSKDAERLSGNFTQGVSRSDSASIAQGTLIRHWSQGRRLLHGRWSESRVMAWVVSGLDALKLERQDSGCSSGSRPTNQAP